MNALYVLDSLKRKAACKAIWECTLMKNLLVVPNAHSCSNMSTAYLGIWEYTQVKNHSHVVNVLSRLDKNTTCMYIWEDTQARNRMNVLYVRDHSSLKAPYIVIWERTVVEKSFRCSECSQLFKQKNDLHTGMHMGIHTGKKKKPWQCSSCSRSLAHETSLQNKNKPCCALHAQARRLNGENI
jgi:hypothetical protein